jgi:hypothetical protein
MSSFVKCIWTILKHKAYVFRAGRWTGAPMWNLIIHDWSKFTPSELPYYAARFHSPNWNADEFAKAWQHHLANNPHHWESWKGTLMPEPYVREMIADWFGASRAYSGAWPKSEDEWEWLNQNYHRMNLHPTTMRLIETVLDEAFAKKKISEQKA